MSASLALGVLEAHRAAEEDGAWALAPTHALLDGEAAGFALAMCDAHGIGRHALERVLVAPARGESLEAAGVRAAAAGRIGAHAARPGAGDAHALHLERFARPGALLVHAGGACSAGALGMLALGADALEIAARIAGAPLWRMPPPIRLVRLDGAPHPGVGGVELAVEVARRVAWRGAIVELHGPGIGTLPIEERIACARLMTAWGAAAVLFPSDERTRSWLRVAGREPDWRRIESDGGSVDAAVDLWALRPAAADPATPDGALPLEALEGQRVARVIAGPALTAAALLRLARAFEATIAAVAVETLVAPGTRRSLAAAEAGGALDVFAASGVHVLDAGGTPPGPVAALWLCAGLEDEAAGGARVVGIEALAAASAGAVRLLQEPPAGDVIAEPMLPAAIDDGIVERPVAPATAAPAAPPFGAPLDGPLRGEVLAVLGDHVAMERILPWGARLAPVASDVATLAGHVLEGEDADFADRARARRGGFVVAGAWFGAGPARVQVAPALASLGVRAVIARGIAPALRAALPRAGVLPLRFARPEDAETFRVGGEIELPDVPEGLVPGAPVVARDLSRGAQIALAHDLAPREIAWLRAGGLLAAAVSKRDGRE